MKILTEMDRSSVQITLMVTDDVAVKSASCQSCASGCLGVTVAWNSPRVTVAWNSPRVTVAWNSPRVTVACDSPRVTMAPQRGNMQQSCLAMVTNANLWQREQTKQQQQ